MILNITKEQYDDLKKSGMFWEWFPEACGTYEKDKEYVVYELNKRGLTS